MLDTGEVLSIVKEKGPLLPVQISKEIGTTILFASAMLSELSSKKEIVVSALKVGGSPLYYVKGQEEKLQNYADRLPAHEKQAYTTLKKSKILADAKLEPAVRVAMRQIRDFARPLEVRHGEQTLLFWKWFTHSNDDVASLIKDTLNTVIPKLKPEPIKVEPTKETLKTIPEVIKSAKSEVTKQPKLTFQDELDGFISTNNIEIIKTIVKRKNSEIDYLIDIPSPVGKLRYFCKAKGKKGVTDGDLSAAFMEAQSKKLPCLFLTRGKLTKKAEELLKDYRGMVVKQI